MTPPPNQAPRHREARSPAAIHLTLLGALIVLAGCGVHSRPQERWVGQVTPTTNAPGCTASRGVLVMRENDVIFAPDEGTWLLYGSAKPGTLTAAAGRLGADRKPYDTKLEATWTQSTVNGTYTTPRCTYEVTLTNQ
jgi:hypothetical protein